MSSQPSDPIQGDFWIFGYGCANLLSFLHSLRFRANCEAAYVFIALTTGLHEMQESDMEADTRSKWAS